MKTRVVPTEFSASNETTFTASASTRDGRLFFAGSDGFVHAACSAARESVVSKILRLGAPPPLEQLPQSGEKRKAPPPSDGFSSRGRTCDETRSIARRVATSVLPPFARPDWLLHPLRFLVWKGPKPILLPRLLLMMRGAPYTRYQPGALLMCTI